MNRRWAASIIAVSMTALAPGSAFAGDSKNTLTGLPALARHGQFVSGKAIHVGSTRRDFTRVFGLPADNYCVDGGKTDLFIFQSGGTTYQGYFRALPASERQDTFADHNASCSTAWKISMTPQSVLAKGTTPNQVERILGHGTHLSTADYTLSYREGQYDLQFVSKGPSQPVTSIVVRQHGSVK